MEAIIPASMPENITCPRCFFTISSAAPVQFCPRCGLKDVATIASDTAPLDIHCDGRLYRVEGRLAIGSISTIYRCRFDEGRRPFEGVFKIAREPMSNALVANESQVLRHLHQSDHDKRFAPFLPTVRHSFAYGTDTPRQANVLTLHDLIHSPDDLYTLGEVRAFHDKGLDGRDVAWIWRRLLNILGFAHSTGVVHGAVLPMHVLIEPKDHKLVLIDWCFATWPGDPPKSIALTGGYDAWYKRDGASSRPPTPAVDVAFGARCMIELLGGNAIEGTVPPTIEPGLARHFERCLGGNADAWKMLEDFDRLIEAMWGPRKFRELPMPSKRKNVQR
jgi:serine/threonine protein kinase